MLRIVSCITISALFFMASCSDKVAKQVKIAGPEFVNNTVFDSGENLRSPKFSALIGKYKLDTAFQASNEEFQRILLLRNWIRNKIHISDFEDNYPGGGYADSIIDAGLAGQGYHCGHYMIVQNAVMNAFGFVTRCIGAGPGVKGGPDWHHGSNEIWSNTYHKWFMSDAKYNHHFEKDGIPLSALEIRDEYLKNGAADIRMVKGIDRVAIDEDSLKDASGKFVRKTKQQFAQAYTWIEFEKQNDRYTNWPANSDNLNIFNIYADDFFHKNTWYWDGKPHWAYNTKFMQPVADRKPLEWTPNTIKLAYEISGDTAHIKLVSITPNIKSYQMKSGLSGSWKDIADSVDIPLENGQGVYSFRTINLADVTGPECKMVIE